MQRYHYNWRAIFTPQLLLCLAIGLAGCLAIYNATFHYEQPFRLVGRQLVWLSIGIIVFFGCSLLPANIYERWTTPLAWGALFSLYFLLCWGETVNGVRGWFTITSTFFDPICIQPSEFNKPIFVLFLAKKSIYPCKIGEIGNLCYYKVFFIRSHLVNPNLIAA